MRTLVTQRKLLRRLVEALDPLRGRLRRHELAAVVKTLAGQRLHHKVSDLALALALVDHADEEAARRAEARLDLERLGSALAAHGQAAAADLLTAHLEARHAEAGDLAALERSLDADAVSEREARAAGRSAGTREVCLLAAANLFAGAIAEMRVEGTITPPSALAPERRLPERMLGHALDTSAPWTLRAAALEAMGRVFGAAPWPPESRLVDALDALADDAADHRWVQIAALRALGVADAPRARRRARERIPQVRPVRDDFIVRARMCRILVEELADPEALPALVAAARDTAEHVRQSTARAAAASGDAGARDILATLADPAGEPSPRVRGVTATALAARARGAVGFGERLPAAEGLARILVSDPDGLVRRVAADEAADVCVDADADREVMGVLLAALDRARAAALPPPIANAVARAAERAHAASDPERAQLRAALADAVARLPETGATNVRLPFAADDVVLGRALAELAQDDFGLYARRKGEDKVQIRRGERMARKAWRVLHEITHPIPTKRQGYVHTVGRVLDAPLRAHPAGMAEVTRTRVPGERVFVPREDGWAPYLPLVDDLLGAALAGPEPARIFSEHGVTTVEPPKSIAARFFARAELTRRYAELAALRLESLEAADAAGRCAFNTAVADLGFQLRFEAHAEARAPRHVRQLFRVPGLGAAAPSLAGDSIPVLGLAPLVPFGDLAHSLSERVGGGVPELAAFAAAATVLLCGRSLATRAEVRSCRRAVPLVIGGWGTRGKSGVERLKAALFHGLGYEVLVKTTGCEATVLVGVPGRPLVEIPLYRPYDKATIWEQRDVLRLAGTRRPHVLLWECMALNPRYVDHLQRGWMRDDYATLTNAYPDHEDIQGPSGLDVARVIARFTPKDATLVTAEDQMLPVLRDQARSLRTRLVSVSRHAHELLPADIIDRFPYEEHPKNIALVLRLAEELGLDPDVALVEMAEHVLPDIGGLRTYGPHPIDGRRLRFTNGMSANERASALGNWQRCGFDGHRVDGEPGRWIVGMVNNRGDRGARTLSFAEAIVEDFAAHRFVLVGSDIPALRRAIDAALARRLSRLRAPELDGFLAQMKIGAATPEAALAEIEAWLGAPGTGLRDDRDLDSALFFALSPAGFESLADCKKAVAGSGAADRLASALVGLGLSADHAAVLSHFAAESWARRRAGAVARKDPESPATRKLLAELFDGLFVVPPDPMGEPDDLISFLATSGPPGALVDVMGLQNIKGPGLAIVYRFAAAEKAMADVQALSAPRAETRAAALRQLRDLDGVGRHVLGLVAAGVAAAAIDESLARLLESRASLAGARAGGRRLTLLGRAAAWLAGSVDHIPSVGRRRRADALFDDLARGQIACQRAAAELGKLLDEQRT